MNLRTKLIVGFTALCVAAAFLLPAVPQPTDYHHFADQRADFGVERFLDVASNAGFLVAGLLGLALVIGRRVRFQFEIERWPYLVFFVGILLTGFGSAYYHLAPDNDRLFWDRLPMTIAFMALVSSQIADRISVRTGVALLVPMLLVGVASVVYWRVTEQRGAGNVLPYAILQAYTVVVLLLLAMLQPSRYTRGSDLFWIFGWYVLSKLLEHFDAQVLALVGVVSGHTLKHLAAAAAGFVACYNLAHRTLKEPANPAPSS